MRWGGAAQDPVRCTGSSTAPIPLVPGKTSAGKTSVGHWNGPQWQCWNDPSRGGTHPQGWTNWNHFALLGDPQGECCDGFPEQTEKVGHLETWWKVKEWNTRWRKTNQQKTKMRILYDFLNLTSEELRSSWLSPYRSWEKSRQRRKRY